MNLKGLHSQSFQLDFLNQNIKKGITNRASLDDSGFQLLDLQAHLEKLTHSLDSKMLKKSSDSASLTKRKSSILNDNPVKKKLSGQSPSNSKHGFDLGS